MKWSLLQAWLATMQAAAGAEDHEEVNMDDALGSKTSGHIDRKANPQIAGNLAPPSESKGANGESGMVRVCDNYA